AGRRTAVQDDGFLAAVEQRKERAAHAGQLAGLVASGRLDLDHLGPQEGQEHAAARPHHHMAHLNDTDPLEGFELGSHEASHTIGDRIGLPDYSYNYIILTDTF